MLKLSKLSMLLMLALCSACATKPQALTIKPLQISVPVSLVDGCIRPAPIDYAALFGLTEIDREKFWTDRDAAWEGSINGCEGRGDALLGLIGDGNKRAKEAAPGAPDSFLTGPGV